jgi:hypothetical protein
MILEDDLVHPYLADLPWLMYVGPVLVVLLVLPAAHWFHRHRPSRSTPAV